MLKMRTLSDPHLYPRPALPLAHTASVNILTIIQERRGCQRVTGPEQMSKPFDKQELFTVTVKGAEYEY